MVENLFTMLIELLNNDMLTAEELAAKLEISPRTVYRYVDALSGAHIPVYCQKGRGGGIMIGDDFKLSANYFSKDELQLILAALDAIQPRSDKVNTVIKKLSAIKNVRSAHQGGFVNEDFVVDNANTLLSNPKLAAKFDALAAAKKERRTVRICYHNRIGEISERDVQPYAFVLSNNNWYVYAYCLKDSALRLFKISRITHIILLDTKYQIPAYEKEWNLYDPTQKEKVRITLKVTEAARYDVEEWLGIENVNRSQDGTYYIAQGEVYDNEATLRKLVGFGADAEVLLPLTVRNKVAAVFANAGSLYNGK